MPQASVAEAALSWLLEVEGVGLDSLAHPVLAVDGVAGQVAWGRPAPGLPGAGKLCQLRQSFKFRRRGEDSGTGCSAAGTDCRLCS